MALHKENYGLIYNDDGSLCTTIRGDDVPFAGVKSFAVEEGTTNLHPSPEDLNAFDGCPSKWSYKGETYNGMKVFEWTVKDGTYPQHIGIDQSSSLGNLVGKTVTFSVYYYVQNVPGWAIYISSNRTIINSYDIDLGGGWKRRIITATLNATTCDFWLNPFDSTTGVFKFCGFQIEQKPFATSFVDGTRPAGRLVIPVEDLKFDIANDDWVISYWKYPVATNDGTQNGYNLCSLGQLTKGQLTKGYIWWGKEKYKNKYRLVVILNDATYISNISANTFNPTDYFYHWHFEVMKKQGKVLSYYVDRVKQCELIIPADKEIQTPFDVGLSLGGYSGSHPNNALIANLLIARYDPAVWTAEYIQELYNMRRPFSTPPKLPII